MQTQLAGAFLAAWVVNTSFRNVRQKSKTCQPGRVTPHPDVQPGPTTRQTALFRAGAMCPRQGTPSTSSEGQQS